MHADPALTDHEVTELAERLRTARHTRRTLTALSQTRPLSLADAYRVQAGITAARLADGEHRIGWKLGYTSRAMREQMSVDAPNFGPLTDVMLLPDGGRVPGTALQPRIEPEIAVVLGERAGDLAGALGDADNDAAVIALVAGAVTAVHAALEVVDSVWTGYRFRLEDNTADGSSAAWFVLGPPLLAKSASTSEAEAEAEAASGAASRAALLADRLPGIGVELWSASSGSSRGTGADADGHPLRGVAWLAARLAERDDRLRPGDVVITGGLTRAVPLDGTVRARFTSPDEPTVEVSVEPPV